MREMEKRKKEENGERSNEKKGKQSFIIDQRNRVSLPSSIAHSIQAVFDFPLKIPASSVYVFVTKPRPAGTRYTMQYILRIQGDLRK